MNFIIILIIIVSVLSSIIGILFWVFIIKAAVNHVKAFEKDQREIMDLINRYSNDAKNGQVPTEINQQLISKFMNMKNHARQMDSFRRQQYEMKISSMVGNVTSAGFTNFDPDSLD